MAVACGRIAFSAEKRSTKKPVGCLQPYMTEQERNRAAQLAGRLPLPDSSL